MNLISFIVIFVAVFAALVFLGKKILPKTDNLLERFGRIASCLFFTYLFTVIVPIGSGWYDGVTISENKEVVTYRHFNVEFINDKFVVTSGDDVIYNGKRDLLSDRQVYFTKVNGPTNLSLNEDSYSSGETEYTKKLKKSQLVVTRVVEKKFILEPGKGLKMKKEIHTESFFAEEVVPRVSFSNK